MMSIFIRRFSMQNLLCSLKKKRFLAERESKPPLGKVVVIEHVNVTLVVGGPRGPLDLGWATGPHL